MKRKAQYSAEYIAEMRKTQEEAMQKLYPQGIPAFGWHLDDYRGQATNSLFVSAYNAIPNLSNSTPLKPKP